MKSEDEWQAEQAALALLDEWTLVTSRLCTLQDLGYRVYGGGVPAWKLRQMLDLTVMIQAAIKRRPAR